MFIVIGVTIPSTTYFLNDSTSSFGSKRLDSVTMEWNEVVMHKVCRSAILVAALSGCSADPDHGFRSVGGSNAPGPGSSGLSAWGECGPESEVDASVDSIVQTVPPAGARNVSVHTPASLYMEEGYTRDDIEYFEVTSNGWGIDGDIVDLKTGGTTIVGFAPLDSYDVAGEVVISVDVRNKNGSLDSMEWQFHTGPYEDVAAGDPNLSFENQATPNGIPCEYTYFTDNFVGFGDVAFTDQIAGNTAATDGSSRLLMTTGEVLGNASVRATTSFVTSQPLPLVQTPVLRFDYQFISEEFRENVGSTHDDSFLIMIHGQQNAVLEEITSVGRMGTSGTSDTEFPGLVNAKGSEWKTHTVVDFDTVGADATISLFVTDVGNSERTTAVSVDNLRTE